MAGDPPLDLDVPQLAAQRRVAQHEVDQLAASGALGAAQLGDVVEIEIVAAQPEPPYYGDPVGVTDSSVGKLLRVWSPDR